MKYYAHTYHSPPPPLPETYWQSLQAHLVEVAKLAHDRARSVAGGLPGLEEAASISGFLHDLGKYRTGFQRKLRGLPVPKVKTYHKQAGAAKAAEWKQTPIAFAIAGHHG